MRQFYQGKKVFVTGNTGFKGSWLSKILVELGAHVRGYSLAPVGKPNLFDLAKIGELTDTVVADVRDLTALKQAIEEFQPSIVFHLAAQPLVRESYLDPVGTYSTNVLGTVNLLEACRGVASIRSIVNVTTDKVYENREWCYGYRECDNLNGYDPYSNSKSCSDLVTASYTKSFFHEATSASISTARAGNVIGGGDFSKDRIIPDCVKAALSGQPIIIRNPNSIRPYQHVLDCLYGYLSLAKGQFDNRQLAGAYNFGPYDGDCVTTKTLVEKFCARVEGSTYAVMSDPNAPHEANFLKLDCSKARLILGWQPKMNIDKAIEFVVDMSRECNNPTRMNEIMLEQIRWVLGE